MTFGPANRNQIDRKTVSAVGISVIDHIMTVDSFKTGEGSFHCEEYMTEGGGMAATALCAASKLGSRTRLKTLTKQTIDDNARFFENEAEVPRFAVTMGVGTILEAKKIIMLANGPKKADIVAQALEGPVTAQVSASALQLHPDVVVILDAPAGKALQRADYYKWVYNEKKRLIPGMIGKTT